MAKIEEQTTQWPKEEENRQHNGQKSEEEQTTQWPKKGVIRIRKIEEQTTQWPKEEG